jgi:O-antigen/teichoic acid export membrane protein
VVECLSVDRTWDVARAGERPRPSSTGGTEIPILRRRAATGASAPPGRGGYSLLFKDSVIYGAGRTVQKLLAALLLPLYTAFLTRSDYGVLGMVVTVTTFLDVFVTLGFDLAFSRFYFDDAAERARRKVITNVFWVSTVYPALLLAACGLLLPSLSPTLLGDAYSPGDWRYFAVGFATLFFTNLNDLPFTLLRLEQRPWTFTAYSLGRVILQVPISILFVATFDWGVMGVLLAGLVTAVLLQLTMLPLYVTKLDFLPDWDVLRPMLKFAVPSLFIGISFYWLRMSDRFFLLHYQGSEEVGLYTVANSLAQPLFLVAGAFGLAWPQWHYSRMDDPEEHKRLVARGATYFLVINGLVLVAFGAMLPLLTHVLIGEQYWSVPRVTFVLAVSIVVYGIYIVFWTGASVSKKISMMPVFFAIASAVNIGLNFVFVPTYGMWAAAWTAVVGFALLAVMTFFYSRRSYAIPFEWPRLTRLLGATLATLGCVAAIMLATGLTTSMPLPDLIWRTALTIPALGVFPLVLHVTGFATAGERRRLHDAWRRLGRRKPPPAAPPEHESAAEAVAAIETLARLDATERDGLVP